MRCRKERTSSEQQVHRIRKGQWHKWPGQGKHDIYLFTVCVCSLHSIGRVRMQRTLCLFILDLFTCHLCRSTCADPLESQGTPTASRPIEISCKEKHSERGKTIMTFVFMMSNSLIMKTAGHVPNKTLQEMARGPGGKRLSPTQKSTRPKVSIVTRGGRRRRRRRRWRCRGGIWNSFISWNANKFPKWTKQR